MDKNKNTIFLLCQIVVAVIGLAFMFFNGRTSMMLMYCVIMAVDIPTMYFNYSLCKWENKWHSRWSERNPCDGEPSEFRLRVAKIGEWVLFIAALIIALLPI